MSTDQTASVPQGRYQVDNARTMPRTTARTKAWTKAWTKAGQTPDKGWRKMDPANAAIARNLLNAQD